MNRYPPLTAAVLIAAAGLAHSAVAQSPSFQYFVQAPATLNPGQSATITVLCGFTPGVGQPVTGGTVLGLSSGIFNLFGSGMPGTWSNVQALPPYNFCGIVACGGMVSGFNVTTATWNNGFGPPLGPVSTVNPTPIWQATLAAPQTSGAVTLTLAPVGAHGIWYMPTGATISSEMTSTSVQGAQAVIVVGTPCYPDCTGDGALTAADFGCFQAKFVAGDPYADCNADGALTVADFGCFQTEFVAGCP